MIWIIFWAMILVGFALGTYAMYRQAKREDRLHGYGKKGFEWDFIGIPALVTATITLVIVGVTTIVVYSDTGSNAAQLHAEYTANLNNIRIGLDVVGELMTDDELVFQVSKGTLVAGSIEKFGIAQSTAEAIQIYVGAVNKFNSRLANARYYSDFWFTKGVYQAPSDELRFITIELRR